jgi:ABC-type uncharacterized transport system substrate-binding protein
MRRRSVIAAVGAAALFSPIALLAQQKVVIGFLGSSPAAGYAPFLEALRQGLAETGFAEGKNLAIEYRWAEGRFDRLPALAADLVGRKIDTIVTGGGNIAALAAKGATSTIPIVFATGGDPVEAGVVTGLGRPGGNVTGVTFLAIELAPKRFELLRELAPQAEVITLLVNPKNINTPRITADVQEAARATGVRLSILEASTKSEIDTAFTTLLRLRSGGLVIGGDVVFTSLRDQLVELASRNAVPVIYDLREFAEAGGLISYGASITAAYRQVGIYAGKILKGAKPADLPVEQPTKFELVINMKTANALGLTVPPSLLARADEVIE